jgi:hypothetical protein
VILGSDGLFDNLYDDEILEEVQSCIDHQTSEHDQQQQTLLNVVPQTISDALAHRAMVVSEDPDNPTSPFQVRAMHEGLYYQVKQNYFIYFLFWMGSCNKAKKKNVLEGKILQEIKKYV